jgi:simple sugar transport system permease protein
MSDSSRGALRDFNQRVDSAFTEAIARIHVSRSVGRIVVLLVATFALFAIINPDVFLSPVNLQNIGLSAPEIGLLALAVMIAMLTGGIDLSVVSIANGTAITVSTVYTAVASSQGPEAAEAMTPLILIAGVAVGMALGAINGLLVSVVGITPILATLGTMQLYNGLALVWTGGITLSGAPAALSTVGTALIFGIPALLWILIAAAIGLAILINRTAIGRKIALQGSNPVASKYSGISSRSTLMMTYVTSGLLSAIAGLVFLSRSPSASADYGSSYILLVIVIVVLGGTSPNGGLATVLGVVLAALTLEVLSSGFTAMRLSAYEYAIAQGLILIAVMVLDQTKFKKRKRPPSTRSDEREAVTEAKTK